ncbi:MAG TPA: hypothetical protein VNV65_04165 [Candidatus Solibacter sp.]|nr:hypothetical protein [Candidatus Solibacter sp.]
MGRRLLSIVRFAMPLAVFAVVASAGTALGATGPVFKQHFGSVDPPCPGAPNTAIAGTCIAHVDLENTGGQGSGVLTLNVPLKGAAQSAQCQAVIPPTGAGDFVDVSCKFAMPPGAQLATPPNVSDITVSAPTTGSLTGSAGGSDLTGIAVLVLAVATALLALGTFTVAQAARRAATAASRSQSPGQRPNAAQPRPADDAYTLPALPR